MPFKSDQSNSDNSHGVAEVGKEAKSPLKSPTVFTDHIEGLIEDYNIRISFGPDKAAVTAEKEVRDLTIRLRRWNKDDARMGGDESIKVPSINFVVRFYFDYATESKSLEPLVTLWAKFPLDGKQMNMTGGTLGDGAVSCYFQDIPNQAAFWDRRGLDRMELDKGFCNKLAGDIKSLREQLGWVLKNYPKVAPAFQAYKVGLKKSERDFIDRVKKLWEEAERISAEFDIDTQRSALLKALLPVVLKARTGPDGELVMIEVATSFHIKKQMIQDKLASTKDASEKTSLEKEADRLHKLGELLYGLGMKDALRADKETGTEPIS